MNRKYIFCIIISLALIIQIKAYALKSNQIINGNFSKPNLGGGQMTFPMYQIPGWSCTLYCEIDNCKVFQAVNVRYHLIYSACQGQVIDLNSINKNQIVTQLIQAKAGTYQISLNYYFPIYNANLKTLLIYFNNKLIFQYKPHVYNEYRKYFMQELVTSIDGVNNFTMTMTGPTSDGSGFNINNVSFQRVYDISFQSMMNSTLLSPTMQNIVSMPAYRVILGELANFFVNFDRWQFYIFHKRKHSYYSWIFLSNIYNLMNMKGNFLQSQLDEYSHFTQDMSTFFNSLNYKANYTDSSFLAINNNGNGFFANNSNIFIYSLPLIVILEIIFLATFHLTFQRRISKLFRKYSLLAIVFFMIFDGNIEQFSFYMFQELSLFFSANYMHKLGNVLLIFIFFSVLFMGIGCYFWFKSYYKKITMYFTENYELKIIGLASCSIDKGLVCLLFGAVHSLLLNYPIVQLLSLMLLESLWICERSYCISNKTYKMKFVIWLQIFSSLNRIVFQLTCIFYQKSANNIINEHIHVNIIYFFLLIWLIGLLVAFKEVLAGIYAICHWVNQKEQRVKVTTNSTQVAQIKRKQRKRKINDYTTFFAHVRRENFIKSTI